MTGFSESSSVCGGMARPLAFVISPYFPVEQEVALSFQAFLLRLIRGYSYLARE